MAGACEPFLAVLQGCHGGALGCLEIVSETRISLNRLYGHVSSSSVQWTWFLTLLGKHSYVAFKGPPDLTAILFF